MNIRNIADLKRSAKSAGSHWFDAGAMRFFNSRLLEGVYRDSDRSGYFVSSERYDDTEPRLYSVRKYVFSEDGSRVEIDTVGEFQGYETAGAARKVAKSLGI